MIEQAFAFLEPTEWEGPFDSDARVYIGTELCPNLMPSSEKLEETLQRFRGQQTTLALPFVPESYLEWAVKLIEIAQAHSPGMEVVVQSWGMIGLVRESGGAPVAGRLLIKKFNDPRLLPHFNSGLPGLALPKVNKFMLGALADMGVERIELDSPPWGLVLPASLKQTDIKISLHTPHSIVSVTRFCKLAQIYSERQMLQIPSCNQECRKFRYELHHPSMGLPLMLYANSFLFESAGIGIDKLDNAIDRIVYHPRLSGGASSVN